ncbi:MAG TPA: glutamate-5-semialdehyde dehydrogenase [Leptospiraceae bacterium]|nr:glutamate-5-semialdehyde dehydrogenase [Leptospiraceae bacterium]HMY67695.1 glutamate-5-semialdehyde dehydrogenase [Leptospiraceae bacterium]HNF13028.1 glutamate-5-semialdehyde dehydrogenase [Leptospiraceae bacterium]HNF26637.1 glutamate-5-semialdehyde dehydrogenase [Leptospiraceae bacterium]HNI97525.1 glutamate-5-semialdehyde dehydrogenase [Leptospiraceae bacterium]
MTEIREYTDSIASRARTASRTVRKLSSKTKNSVLLKLADLLKESSAEIIRENSRDIEEGKAKNLSPSLLDRLLLNEKRIDALASAVREIAALPDPVGEVKRGLRLPNGLELVTKRVPLGTVLVIYESRPNVTIDVAALAFKSGNAAILRGGSEAIHSNKILCGIFRKLLESENISPDAVVLVERTDRSYMVPLLKNSANIDIVVPRGGEALIQFVSENSLIPVVKHDKGVCNMFVDESADIEKAAEIIVNSKLQRTGVCNALENLFIHRNYPDTKNLLKKLSDAGAVLLLDENIHSEFPSAGKAEEKDFYEEFLDSRLSVRAVSGIDEAIENITKYSSGHTEAILSEKEGSIRHFLENLDSAALFVNCSTRFHDGGEFGLGAEVGISTGKLHVRGPMGLVHLTTETTVLIGTGQTRT